MVPAEWEISSRLQISVNADKRSTFGDIKKEIK